MGTSPVTLINIDPIGLCVPGENPRYNYNNGNLWYCEGTWNKIGPASPGVPSGNWSNLSNAPFVDPSAFLFTLVPGGILTAGVPATINIPFVPLGVNGSDTQHYVYISNGVGTTEAVLITGGTATSGGSGTLQFTPANNHSGAWTITSASAGIKEASISLNSNGVISLSAKIYNIFANLILPTTISMYGTGGNILGVVYRTILNFSSGGLIIADGLSFHGIGEYANFQIIGPGSGNGLWLGGDPNNVFAPSAWLANYVIIRNVVVNNFTNALVLYGSNFGSTYKCQFNGLTRALLVPSNALGSQPFCMFETILTVPGPIAVQQDFIDFGASPIKMFGGQVAGTWIGQSVSCFLFGCQLEPNAINVRIFDINNVNQNNITLIGCKPLSVHGSGTLDAMIKVINTAGGPSTVIISDCNAQCDVGMTVTNFVLFNMAVAGILSIKGVNIAPAGTFTNLFSTPGAGILTLLIEQPGILPNIAAAATLVFPIMNFPYGGILAIIGATVGGGINSITGPGGISLQFGQTGIFRTNSAQTFNSGAGLNSIGNSGTTTANLPYSYYFDGTQTWIFGKGF